MKIHLIRHSANQEQINEMLEEHVSYIKVAVDVRHGILAGGGEFHADCESALLENGSLREDVWGADWIPAEQVVRCSALINIRSRVNPSMEIHDLTVRGHIEAITRRLLGRA